jgi:hypothetical protein
LFPFDLLLISRCWLLLFPNLFRLIIYCCCSHCCSTPTLFLISLLLILFKFVLFTDYRWHLFPLHLTPVFLVPVCCSFEFLLVLLFVRFLSSRAVVHIFPIYPPRLLLISLCHCSPFLLFLQISTRVVATWMDGFLTGCRFWFDFLLHLRSILLIRSYLLRFPVPTVLTFVSLYYRLFWNYRFHLLFVLRRSFVRCPTFPICSTVAFVCSVLHISVSVSLFRFTRSRWSVRFRSLICWFVHIWFIVTVVRFRIRSFVTLFVRLRSVWISCSFVCFVRCSICSRSCVHLFEFLLFRYIRSLFYRSHSYSVLFFVLF